MNLKISASMFIYGVIPSLKMRMVRNRDKQEREWQQYKEEGIATAIKRAEFEAVKYLESAEGSVHLRNSLFTSTNNYLPAQKTLGRRHCLRSSRGNFSRPRR